MAVTFDEAKDRVAALVAHFRANNDRYLATAYKETWARQEFIDPFFEALGWDVRNERRVAPQYREVVTEDSLDVEGHRKAPDYAFRVGQTNKFFAEAKKPGVAIKSAPAPAYQLRRYAWSAKLPLSILTDFQELAVYDCRKRPRDTDKASAGRILYLSCEEYPDRFREVWDLFGREAVWSGSFDRFAQADKGKRGTGEVDAEFLKEIEEWRLALARNIALRNPRIKTDEELIAVVQRAIDRIVFLRICEDRAIEEYGQLMALLNGANVYRRLCEIFYRADHRYNSGLFHFQKEEGRAEPPDELSLRLAIDDKVLKDIIKGLYFPASPYEFSVMPAEVLGAVYEQFLGKVIRLTAGHQAKVEDKPEVKKAGGVYYTPKYIVDYIVKNTVGRLLAQNPAQSPVQSPGFSLSSPNGASAPARSRRQPEGWTLNFRVLDPACGSGSFLIGAYQCLLDWHLDWYVAHDPETWAGKKNPPVCQSRVALPDRDRPSPSRDPQTTNHEPRFTNHEPRATNHALPDWRLTTAERKRILLAHIYGVDIDPQAVEVTKLSLLLKVLEGENEKTMAQQLELFGQRALPDLAANIKCGNSLIGPDYFTGSLLPDADELRRINPFDWKTAFPDAMKSGGFDCVIGNPPYVILTKDVFSDPIMEYLNGYMVAEYKTDLFHLFIEKGISLLKTDGELGFIVPNTWFTLQFTRKLRGYVLANTEIDEISVFTHKVFQNADVHTGLIFLRRCQPISEHQVRVRRFPDMFSPDMLYSSGSVTAFQRDWVSDPEAQFDIRRVGQAGQIAKRSLEEFPALARVARASLGTQAYNSSKHTAEQIRNRVFHSPTRLSGEYLPELSGNDVQRYYFQRNKGQWIKYGPWLHDYRTMDWLTGPRILVREISGKPPYCIHGCYLEDTYCNYKTILNVNPSGNTQISMKYLVGLLNSRFLSFLYPLVSNKIVAQSFPRLSVGDLKRLPIRSINLSDPSDRARHDRMVALVEQMLELHKRLHAAETTAADRERYQRQIDATDREIDRLVYDLYGLTGDEIKIVEEGQR